MAYGHDDRTEEGRSYGGRGGGRRYEPYGGGRKFGAGGGGGAPRASSDCKVFVEGLPWKMSWQDLKDLFRSCGDVTFTKVMLGADGRSKGCGIVEFSSAEDAQNAISQMDNTEIEGRSITVREDKGFEGGGGGGGGGRSGGPARRSGGRGCFTCGQEGHRAAECSQGAGGGGGGGGRGERKEKKPLDAGGLDNDLDAYFANRVAKTTDAPAADGDAADPVEE